MISNYRFLENLDGNNVGAYLLLNEMKWNAYEMKANESITEGLSVKYKHEAIPLAEVGVGIPQLVLKECAGTLNMDCNRKEWVGTQSWVIQMRFFSSYCVSFQLFILGFSCFLTLLCTKTHLVRATTLLSNQRATLGYWICFLA